ncbi:MAG: FecR/PupR family sigma factor regulator [Steroidobacteraceae bacterium]|jgi:ferric-dicitrate binding protein FerR (iron transport regulator)
MSELRDWFVEDIPEAIRRDAEGWMAVLDSSHCSEAHRLAFVRWLEEDPRRGRAFEELSEVWARLRVLSELPALKHEAGVIDLFKSKLARPPAHRHAPFRASDRATAAAAVLVAVGLIAHWAGLYWGG